MTLKRDISMLMKLLPRSEQKIKTTLNWIFYNNFSSDEIIRKINQIEARGYAAKLAKDGLLNQIKTQSGIPKHIFILTRAGLNKLKTYHPGREDFYEQFKFIDSSKVNHLKILHDLECQHLSLFYSQQHRENRVDNHKSSLLFRTIDGKFYNQESPKFKQFDAVWHFGKDNLKVGIELERNEKVGTSLLQKFRKIQYSLDNDHVDRVIIFTNTNSIFTKYTDVINGKKLSISAQESWSFKKSSDVEIIKYGVI